MSNRIRCHILQMTRDAKSGHYMSSLSCVEILVSLFFSGFICDSDPCNRRSRDHFILSKGHAAPALYAILTEMGYIHKDELKTLRQYGSRLQGHPVYHKLPCLDCSSGSLGQGLSVAVGMSLSLRLDLQLSHIYVLIGDGECQEGQLWEAAMAAVHYKLDSIIAIIDKNNLQISGSVDEVMSLGDLESKWNSFGWEVFSVNGHDLNELGIAFQKARMMTGKPKIIIADTIKGYGVSFIEGNLCYHTAPLTDEEFTTAMQILRGC